MNELLKIIEQEYQKQGIKITDRPEWNEYFMSIAEEIASRSTCHNRKVGAVIVRDRRIIATGYNGAAGGLTSCFDIGYCLRKNVKEETEQINLEGIDEERKQKITSIQKELIKNKTQRYCKAQHAEENAIIQAAAQGISIEGADMYCTLEPCERCTRIIISTKLNKVYLARDYKDSEKFNNHFDKYLQETIQQSKTKFEYTEISPKTRLILAYEKLKGNVSRNRNEK